MTEDEDRRLKFQEVVDTIERLLRARRVDATICPSEVARALAGDDGPWRSLMPQVRDVAASLAQQGRLRVTRRAVEVDARSPGGPIRLGWPRPDPEADRS